MSVGRNIIKPIEDETGHARKHHLASLAFKKRLKMIIAQLRILHVDFTYYADLDLWNPANWNSCKILSNSSEIGSHALIEVSAVCRELLTKNG